MRGLKAQSSALRVLLVHANPCQQVLPVPAYGLERLCSSASGLGHTIEILDPYIVFEHPLAQTEEYVRQFAPDVVGVSVRVIDDCIVVDSLEAPENDVGHDVAYFLPEIAKLVGRIRTAAPQALLVAGGAGFSLLARECLDYLQIDWGVVGAGEQAFPAILKRVAEGAPPSGLPGVIGRGEAAVSSGASPYQLGFTGLTNRDLLYAPVNGFPVRTRIGCAMACSYCLTANLHRQHSDGQVSAVIKEIEQIVVEAQGRSSIPVQLMFADDEFNLPDERHPRALLTEIVRRGLSDSLRWRAYLNPAPFSDELAQLIVATNGEVSFTIDTASEEVMRRTRKPFGLKQLQRLVEVVERHQVEASFGFIFGLPGETEETLAQTVAFIRSLPRRIAVYYSAGARVYPHTPLAAAARAEPAYVYGDAESDSLEPTVFCAPMPPRELARALDRLLADRARAQRVGVGFRRGNQAISRGYRALRDNGDWQKVLTEAAAGEGEQNGDRLLQQAGELALWYGRADLAEEARRTRQSLSTRTGQRKAVVSASAT